MARRDTVSKEERDRRKAAVEAVAVAIYGASWQTQFAADVSALAKRSPTLERTRVAGWYLNPPPDKATSIKPVPVWVMETLPEMARRGAVLLRQRADDAEAAAASIERGELVELKERKLIEPSGGDGGEGAPPAPGEPEEPPAPPQSPADYKAADEAFHAWLDSYVEGIGSEPEHAP